MPKRLKIPGLNDYNKPASLVRLPTHGVICGYCLLFYIILKIINKYILSTRPTFSAEYTFCTLKSTIIQLNLSSNVAIRYYKFGN